MACGDTAPPGPSHPAVVAAGCSLSLPAWVSPAKPHVLWCGCELTSFFLSPQYEVSGEEHLYSDFPEIDLSQLDASDLDSASCFSELQWCAEHSETESSQYSTDDSELFQVPWGHRDVGRCPSGCWSHLHLPMGDCRGQRRGECRGGEGR